SYAGILPIAVATIAVKPAAGPLTLSCEPLRLPITIPPIMPAIRPEKRGAPEPNAIPRHKGNATKNTTTEEDKSAPAVLKNFFIIYGFRKRNTKIKAAFIQQIIDKNCKRISI